MMPKGISSRGRGRSAYDPTPVRPKEPTDAWPPRLQAVNRTFDVLDLLAKDRMSVGDVANTLGVNKSTASRLLAAMVSRGFAIRYPRTGNFRLGPRIAELYETYLASYRLGREASALVARVASLTGETVLLTAYESGAAVYIDKVESEHALRTSSRVGEHAPLHIGAAGKAILAALPTEESEMLLEYDPPPEFRPLSSTDRAALTKELARIRRQGYAVSVEEVNAGVVGIGVPLLGPIGRPVGAISVTAPRVRFMRQVIPSMANDVRSLVQRWQNGDLDVAFRAEH